MFLNKKLCRKQKEVITRAQEKILVELQVRVYILKNMTFHKLKYTKREEKSGKGWEKSPPPRNCSSVISAFNSKLRYFKHLGKSLNYVMECWSFTKILYLTSLQKRSNTTWTHKRLLPMTLKKSLQEIMSTKIIQC